MFLMLNRTQGLQQWLDFAKKAVNITYIMVSLVQKISPVQSGTEKRYRANQAALKIAEMCTLHNPGSTLCHYAYTTVAKRLRQRPEVVEMAANKAFDLLP